MQLLLQVPKYISDKDLPYTLLIKRGVIFACKLVDILQSKRTNPPHQESKNFTSSLSNPTNMCN
jgi:hypothetical protein